jgi:tRNA A37 N6-isopentenylltransferase MiaA
MRRTFFIVGPTATGKSELAADVAQEIGAEIVGADAFQIYRGLDLLTAKPDGSSLAKAPHHLIGTTLLRDEMNAEKYRRAASRAIDEINSRRKLAIIVGGSGLYIKALTHGLAPLPESDPELREKLNAMSLDDLRSQLVGVDPETARKIDLKNRRRVVRALEICFVTGKSASEQRQQWIGDANNPRSGGLQSAVGAIWRSPLLEMILQPCKIFIRASRIHDEQILLFADAIYNQVVNDPAAVIEQKRVLARANSELVDIVSQHAVKPIATTSAVHDELAHVRNVEDADIVSHCQMFLDDAGVLHRH